MVSTQDKKSPNGTQAIGTFFVKPLSHYQPYAEGVAKIFVNLPIGCNYFFCGLMKFLVGFFDIFKQLSQDWIIDNATGQ